MKPSALRVLGPYQEPHGFRLVVLEGSQRKALKYPTREQAEHSKALLQREVAKQGGRSIGDALAEYQTAMVQERGRLESTARETCPRLARFLPTEEALTALTPVRAESLYRAETERILPDGRLISVATHQMILTIAKSFFGWCVEKGYVAANPFAKVRKLGKAKTGKLQLTANEGRRFLEAAMEMAQAGDAGALAAALQLSLGLRSSEVLARCVRDIDEGGTVLIIPDGKTDNARRRPQVPDFLRPHLLTLIQGKAPAELLFGDHGVDNSRSTFLRRKVQEICKRAGVPVVCAHSLRGLHATLALRQGVSSQAVAAALGHGSFAVTARHYADPSAIVDAGVRNVMAALGPQLTSTASPLPALAQSLRATLSTPDLATLIELLIRPESVS